MVGLTADSYNSGDSYEDFFFFTSVILLIVSAILAVAAFVGIMGDAVFVKKSVSISSHLCLIVLLLYIYCMCFAFECKKYFNNNNMLWLISQGFWLSCDRRTGSSRGWSSDDYQRHSLRKQIRGYWEVCWETCGWGKFHSHLCIQCEGYWSCPWPLIYQTISLISQTDSWNTKRPHLLFPGMELMQRLDTNTTDKDNF